MLKIFKTAKKWMGVSTPKKRKSRRQREVTLHALFEMTWDGHWSQERYQASGWGKEAKRIYLNYISGEFGGDRLSLITPGRIRKWHQKFIKQPYKANRCLEVLSKLFNYAEEVELRPPGTNPCQVVKSFTEKKRSRFATEEELKRIGQILVRESRTHPQAAAFLYTMMFSGSRPSAIERARWDQLQILVHNDTKFGVLNLQGKSTSDTGDNDTVVLPEQVLALINKLPRKSELIFNCKMPRKMWQRIREEAECENLWARDLRRTFATVGLSTGIGIGILGELLNHRSTQTTKRYAKLLERARFDAVGQIATKLDTLIKGDKK
jgi:integrase